MTLLRAAGWCGCGLKPDGRRMLKLPEAAAADPRDLALALVVAIDYLWNRTEARFASEAGAHGIEKHLARVGPRGLARAELETMFPREPSPFVAGGLVMLLTLGKIELVPDTGEERWRLRARGPVSEPITKGDSA